MTTRMQSDKDTRKNAIPFQAASFVGANDDFESTDADRIISDDLVVTIRSCTPKGMNIKEAHLFLQLGAGSALSVKVAIGRFSDGIFAEETYSEEYIDAMSAQMTGLPDGIESSGGVLLVDGLNLLPFIPQRGHADFNEEGFVLLLKFNRARDNNDSYIRYDIACSGQLGLI